MLAKFTATATATATATVEDVVAVEDAREGTVEGEGVASVAEAAPAFRITAPHTIFMTLPATTP
jgi:hypothetical protein